MRLNRPYREEDLMTDTMANGGASGAAGQIRNDYPWLAKYPETVDWSAQLKGEPLPDILDRTVRDYGNSTCTYFMGATMKYKEIGALADKAAKGLQELGIGKGARVGLLLPNVPYYPILYYGILKAGGIVVNFNPLYTLEELERQAKDRGIDMMMTLDL
jgi:long-chain acyl-CoA synthetase